MQRGRCATARPERSSSGTTGEIGRTSKRGFDRLSPNGTQPFASIKSESPQRSFALSPSKGNRQSPFALSPSKGNRPLPFALSLSKGNRSLPFALSLSKGERRRVCRQSTDQPVLERTWPALANAT